MSIKNRPKCSIKWIQMRKRYQGLRVLIDLELYGYTKHNTDSMKHCHRDEKKYNPKQTREETIY